MPKEQLSVRSDEEPRPGQEHDKDDAGEEHDPVEIRNDWQQAHLRDVEREQQQGHYSDNAVQPVSGQLAKESWVSSTALLCVSCALIPTVILLSVALLLCIFL